MPDQPAPASDIPGPGDFSQEPVFRPVSSVATTTGRSGASTGTVEQSVPPVPQPGPEKLATGPPSQPSAQTAAVSSAVLTGSGGVSFLPEQAYRNPPEQQLSEEENSEAELSGGEEEGELSSDGLEKQEQTEDLTFRETVSALLWAGIIFRSSKVIWQNRTRLIIHGEESTPGSRHGFQWQCRQTTGCAKNLKNLIQPLLKDTLLVLKMRRG